MTRETENSDPNAKTVIFAINPNSGAKDRRALCESIAKTLESDGFDVRLLTDLDDVESSTQEALSSGSLRAVVAAGGDGTVSLLANLLPRETPFAILPLGTENLLGRHLGLRAEESSFVSLIHSGKVTRLDAGDANGKLFFVVASCGFDAAVVKRLDETRTGHISYVSWLKPTFQTISKYRFPPLKLTIDGEEAVEPVRWAFIFNIPRYAMSLRITPDAMDADGKLDVCTFRGGGVIRGVWYLVATWLGMHKGISASSFSQFESMRIEAEDDQTVQYELDGDPGGVLPLEIQVRPKALKILVPDSRN